MSYLSKAELNGGFNGNYGGGSIGEKSRILGKSFNYGRNNGIGLRSSRGGGGVVHMSCLGWGMLSGGGKRRFGYMSNTGIASSFEI
ncbi:hypothetical protein Bca4012_068334 [Brassica carinata]